MADATYQPKVYRKQGGNEIVIASGGTITMESGGVFAGPTGQAVSIAQTTTTATAMTATGVAILNGILTALAGVGILAPT